jgi:hypothetical protein
MQYKTVEENAMSECPKTLWGILRAIVAGYYLIYGKVYHYDESESREWYLIPSDSLFDIWIENGDIG